MKNDKILKIALIGSGGIAGTHAKSALLHKDKFEILGVCDVYIEQAKKLADSIDQQTACFDSMESLYDSIGDKIDAVVVCTPHFLHAPAEQYFLQRGIPALVEKPMVCSLEEWEKVHALESNKAFIQVAQMMRFDPEAVWLKNFVQDKNRFGDPVSFDLNVWQNIEGYVMGNYDHWILDGKKAGGGICASVAIHAIDLIRFLTGQDFTELKAIGRFDPPMKNGAESSCSILVQMSGGLQGSIHASYKPSRVPYSQRLVLFGERGSIYQDVEKVGDYQGAFQYIDADPVISEFSQMYSEFKPVLDEVDGKNTGPDGWLQPYELQLLHFRETVLNGNGATENSSRVNKNTIAFLDALAESLKSGRTVTIANN